MGRHDKHLPVRRFKNKAVKDDIAAPADHARVARAQGTGTKEDAKAARQGDGKGK